MSDFDLTAMIGNISRSLLPVEALVTGYGYLLGLIFVFIGLMKLKKIGDHHTSGGGMKKCGFLFLSYWVVEHYYF